MGRPTRQRPGNYAEQARTYDLTRAASPTVVRAVTRFLGEADGRRLIDVAAGTGNYSQVFASRGFDVVLVDAELAMLRRSVPKVGAGRQIVGDALALPVRDASADRVTIVNAIHLFEDPVASLRETRRVVRDGPLVFTAFTRENTTAMFVYEYFGLDEPLSARPPAAEIEAMVRDADFSRVESATYVYLDTADGSLNALHTDPLKLAGPAYLRNTSFFQRLDDQTRRAGLARLETDLRSGALERRVKDAFERAVSVGHGTVFAAWP